MCGRSRRARCPEGRRADLVGASPPLRRTRALDPCSGVPREQSPPQKLAILPDVEEQEHDETGGGEGEGEAPDMAGLKAMMQGMGGMGGMGGGAGGMGYVSLDVDVG